MKRTSALYLLCALLLLLSILVGCMPAAVEPVVNDLPEEEVIPEPESVTVNLRAVGDNLIHDVIYKQAAARAADGGYDFGPAYEHVADLIRGNDFMFINQETILAGSIAPLSTYPMFNSPMELGEQLIGLGFNLIGQSNNHMFDKGEAGLRTCIEFWKSHPEVMMTGAYLNDADMHTPKTFTVKGITVGMVAATQHTNGLYLPGDSELRYVPTDDRERMAELVAEAKQVSDLVVASIHWGNEGTHQVTDYQRDYAQYLADLGVDIILGTHSHTLQPMQWLERENGGKTFVIYSLGNFISAQSSNYNMPAGMVDITITKDLTDGEITIDEVRFIPTVTHYDYGMKDVRIYPLMEYPEELAAAHGVNAYTPFNLDYAKDTVRQVIDPQFWDEELTGFLAG